MIDLVKLVVSGIGFTVLLITLEGCSRVVG